MILQELEIWLQKTDSSKSAHPRCAVKNKRNYKNWNTSRMCFLEAKWSLKYKKQSLAIQSRHTTTSPCIPLPVLKPCAWRLLNKIEHRKVLQSPQQTVKTEAFLHNKQQSCSKSLIKTSTVV